MMFKRLVATLCLLAGFACSAVGMGTADQTRNRVVAIGDIHGDYDQFVKLLRAAGLVNKRNKWIGKNAHLVQMGDIPDRGPDTGDSIVNHLGRKKAAVIEALALRESTGSDGAKTTVQGAK